MLTAYGERIRQARRSRGLTLDRLAASLGISKSYLSLIETGRLANPPADDKLRRLETELGFAPGELLHEAQLHRTPEDIKTMLAALAGGRTGGVDLDAAYWSGVLRKCVGPAGGHHAGEPNVEPVRLGAVPVINRVSAGSPGEFADLPHPQADADAYAPCPAEGIGSRDGQDAVGVADPHAFAARVIGQSMAPKYAPGDVVVFSPAAAVRDGDDCYVRFDDGRATFKRVYFETDAGGVRLARLEPRNPTFESRRLPAEHVTGVYRAVYRLEALGD